MTRPALTERRRIHTRREIAESALGLFFRDGYDNVSAEAIAEEAGVSLRTFYRYFSTKDEVLSPIITDRTLQLVAGIAARPAVESLATAVQRAYGQVQPEGDGEHVRALITLLTGTPTLRSRWLHDLRMIEDALVPVVHQRARRPLSDKQAHLTAAAVVTGLRVALEFSVDPANGNPSADRFGDALRYLRDGAKL